MWKGGVSVKESLEKRGKVENIMWNVGEREKESCIKDRSEGNNHPKRGRKRERIIWKVEERKKNHWKEKESGNIMRIRE